MAQAFVVAGVFDDLCCRVDNKYSYNPLWGRSNHINKKNHISNGYLYFALVSFINKVK